MTIIPLRKSEPGPEYGKILVIGDSSSNLEERNYCLMCQYLSGRYDSIMKYDKHSKVWTCLVCRYVIDQSLNQTVKREYKPTIENDSTTTRPIAIPLKNFSASAEFQEDKSLRPKPKYSTASEAWRADDRIL